MTEYEEPVTRVAVAEREPESARRGRKPLKAILADFFYHVRARKIYPRGSESRDHADDHTRGLWEQIQARLRGH